MISVINRQIQELSFTEGFVEDEYLDELSRCDQYDSKINYCLTSLDELLNTSVTQPVNVSQT